MADWEWALGVNLWSVIHGVRLFVPIMRAQQSECYIVNTASIAGLISPPGLGIYRTTKHAVVAFSEALAHELAEQAPHINVSVLCPGMVRTHIMQSAYRIGTLPSAMTTKSSACKTQWPKPCRPRKSLNAPLLRCAPNSFTS